jgi:hypothetical protein
MNIIHIRDTMKFLRDAGQMNSKMLHALLHAPVFHYDFAADPASYAMTDEQYNWCEQNLTPPGEDNPGILRRPYPAFSLFARGGEDHTCYFVLGEKYPIEFAHSKLQAMEVPFTATRTGRSDLCIIRHDVLPQRRGTATVCAGYSQQFLGAECHLDGQRVHASPDTITKAVVTNYKTILRFCYDVLSNTNAVVRVAPKATPGKSVEWHLARTHYCLLTKQQAMKARDTKLAVTDHDLKRAAHWRRAHFRRLKAARFKHKQGQLVPVSESWVGPDEWQGLDGKIYKVMNTQPANQLRDES